MIVRAVLVAFALLFVARAASAAAPATRRIAIVVGANSPPPQRAALRFAHDDARELADTLQRVGGFASADVHVLLDPHPRDLVATFDDVTKAAASAGGDVLFLFYYSGHSDGQSLFPHGEAIALTDLRHRVEHVGARIRVGILDTCRGGSWTQSKGLSVGPPLRMADLMNVDTEGTALVSSSSGLENAHEAAEVHGSFFTHYLNAGLRGAADRAGDGNVTLEEAFEYAKERTVRDSARIATTPQHPSFDLALRGRHDIVLTVLSPGTSALEVLGAHGSLEIIHLPSGVTVADAPNGNAALRVALAPGRYLVRTVENGRVHAKELEVKAGQTVSVSAGQLEVTGSDQLAMKGSDDDDAEAPTPAPPPPPPPPPAAQEKKRGHVHLAFPRCDPESDTDIGLPSGCAAVAGVRGSVVGTTGGNGARGAGLQFALDSEEHSRRGLMSELARYRLGIGGGGAGFEGTLAGLWALGLRVPVTSRQGPIVRAGLQGYIVGNDAFYASLLELPQVQGGWQWANGATVFEAAATSGVALTGRFRAAGSDSRELSGFTYGGHVSIHVPWGRVSLVGERISSGDALGGPVDVATGTACVTVSPVALCGDARAEQADAVTSTVVSRVRMFYAGLTIGLTSDH